MRCSPLCYVRLPSRHRVACAVHARVPSASVQASRVGSTRGNANVNDQPRCKLVRMRVCGGGGVVKRLCEDERSNIAAHGGRLQCRLSRKLCTVLAQSNMFAAPDRGRSSRTPVACRSHFELPSLHGWSCGLVLSGCNGEDLTLTHREEHLRPCNPQLYLGRSAAHGAPRRCRPSCAAGR